MKEKNKIYRLIELEYSGNQSKEQQAELDCWRKESSEHETEYQEVRKVYIYSQRLQAMKKIDTSKDLALLKSRMGKTSPIRKLYSGFQHVAAVLVVPLLLASIWIFMGQPKFNQEIIKSTETAFGVRSQIELSDGTKVWLNSGSQLFYPEEFSGKKREVKLVGEAYFQVQSDKDYPFYVEVGNYAVKATGTSFNISNYPDDLEMTTFLESGKVDLIAIEGGKEVSYGKLSQGQKIVADKSGNKVTFYTEANSKKHLGWIDGKLLFHKDSIGDVARRLGHWFNAEIIIDDESLNDYFFTATFTNESLEEALRLLKFSSPIEYQIINNKQLDDSSFAKRKVIIRKGRK